MHHLGLNPFSLQALYWLGCGGYSGEGHCTTYFAFLFHCVVKPRTNGHILANNVPALLDVTCCVRLYTLCMLLHVVACCWSCCAKFETSQTFSSQHFFCFVIADTWSPNSYGLYPPYDALQVPLLLWGIASVCTPLSLRHATTPNIVGPTMLSVWSWTLPQFPRSFMFKSDKNSERNVTKDNF